MSAVLAQFSNSYPVWGYGVRSFVMGRTFARSFSLSLIAGCICAAVAVPVVLALFHDGTGHAADGLAETFQALGLSTVAAVFAGTLMTTIPDALVSGFVALCALLFVHARWRSEHGVIPLLDQLCLPRRTSGGRASGSLGAAPARQTERTPEPH